MPRPLALSFRLGESDIDLIDRLALRLKEKTGVPHKKIDVLRAALHQLGKREGVAARKKTGGEA